MTRRRHLAALTIPLGAVVALSQAIPARASTDPGLGTAASFALLAGTTVTNTGSSIITGDLGVSPGTAVTGVGGGGATLNGTQHTGTDSLAVSAKNDLGLAYGVATSSPCNFNKTGQDLGGLTLTPGTYCQTTAPTLSGTLTLSGNGVFIFQVGSTLVTAPSATVQLINGAQACHVFWAVGSSATLDTRTTFVGTIMASTDITLNNGATVAGRALAQTGQVSLITNTITVPTTCTPTTSGGPTPTAAPTATATVSAPSASSVPAPTTTPSRKSSTPVPVPHTGAAENTVKGLGFWPSGGLLVIVGAVLTMSRRAARWPRRRN